MSILKRARKAEDIEVFRKLTDHHLKDYVEHLRRCPNAYTKIERAILEANKKVLGLPKKEKEE
jgi:hypothetical protein